MSKPRQRRSPSETHLQDGELFVTVVTACLLVFAICLLVYGINSGDYPSGATATLPDWIESLSTLAAFGAASAAAIYAARVVGVERQRDHRRQASSVAVWLDNLSTLDTIDPTKAVVSHGVNGANLLLRNASDVPVTGIEVRVYYDGGAQGGPEAHIIHGNWTFAPPQDEPHSLPLRLGEGIYVPWSVLGVTEGAELAGHCLVELSFIDAQGIRWVRDGLGVLTEVPLDFTIIPTSSV